MKKSNLLLLLLASSFIFLLLFTASCKKDDAAAIGDRVSLEQYTNSTGFDMQITTYMRGTLQKTFTIQRDSVLNVQNPLGAGLDTTGTLFYADSVNLVFSDGKSFMLRDTVSTTANFLNNKNIKISISPSGQTHYYRYTFTPGHYALATE